MGIELKTAKVAAIMPGEGYEDVDIVLHLRGGGVRNISPAHRSYDPLAYVLLNPYGLDGWTPGLVNLAGKPISVADFYAFHLQVLDKSFQILGKPLKFYCQGESQPVQHISPREEALSAVLGRHVGKGGAPSPSLGKGEPEEVESGALQGSHGCSVQRRLAQKHGYGYMEQLRRTIITKKTGGYML